MQSDNYIESLELQALHIGQKQPLTHALHENMALINNNKTTKNILHSK